MSSKLGKILGCLTVVVSGFLLYKKTSPQTSVATTPPALPVVAITQIIEHQALDQERAGIIAVLEKAGYQDGKNIKIIYQNAQGNIGTASQIITQFVSQKPSVIVAISTPSAQTAYPPCLKSTIPLVFTAVTDPVGAKLIRDMSASRPECVTGVSDHLPLTSQIQLVQDFIPGLRTLGVIYNAGEANSVAIIKELKAEAEKLSIELIEATASKTSEVSSAMTSLVGKVEAVYIPNDNTAVAAMKSITQLGEKHKLPVFAGDTGSVDAGAIATRGYDRFALGKKAGELVLQILKGTPAGELPVASGESMQLTLNIAAAEKMGLSVPPGILATARLSGAE